MGRAAVRAREMRSHHVTDLRAIIPRRAPDEAEIRRFFRGGSSAGRARWNSRLRGLLGKRKNGACWRLERSHDTAGPQLSCFSKPRTRQCRSSKVKAIASAWARTAGAGSDTDMGSLQKTKGNRESMRSGGARCDRHPGTWHLCGLALMLDGDVRFLRHGGGIQ